MKRYKSIFSENINYTSWVEYDKKNIEIEYKFEWLNKWPSRYKELRNLFPTLESFWNAVNFSKIENISEEQFSRIQNTTHFKTLEDLNDFVQNYKWPRPVYEIADRFKQNLPMPYAIVCRWKGNLIILSGNTRSNVCIILGVPLKVKILDLDAIV